MITLFFVLLITCLVAVICFRVARALIRAGLSIAMVGLGAAVLVALPMMMGAACLWFQPYSSSY